MDGGDVAVANVHLVALARNIVKYSQVALITKALLKYTVPTVILGDFNISSLSGKKKLLKLMVASGYESSKKRILTHRVGIFRHQFDYVFTRRMKIRTIRSYRLRFSDHYPIHVSGFFV
jgi:endonuclease/exonuclease/phosphatase family metal-dependent hydrolase